eukprot:TRINITY_DN1857_c0_g3_i2.p1 TRINITY_DN1857_c0_g3~~TRINITY_DN1857_c0_g3_i2.p1  ORF type:complete len:313 (-),score=40.01 TRINITY_DN1857_c0_g3_i2:202-1140(-)
MAIAATNLCVRSSSLKTIETPSLPRSSSFSSPANSPFSKSLRGRIARHHLQVSLCLNNRFNINNARKRAVRVFCASIRKLAETEALSLDENPRRLTEKIPSSTGVYAMLDKNGDTQFIGVSLRISHSVLSHLRHVPDLCGAVKIGLVDAQDRATLTDAWKAWMEEHINSTGKVPPGNDSGNTTWVRKQKQGKSDIRLTPGRHVQLTVSLEELIDKLVKENKVVAFIKGSRNAPQCGFSHQVLTLLNELGVDYESLNVLDEEHNPGLRETLKVYSNWPTFPQVFVNGELLGGADIIMEMFQKGELQKLFSARQ